MRIIGGRWRGLRLASVGKGDAAAHLRPTSDRVRESLFSLLDGGRIDATLEGATVLDLFAGTGALGLEALSRGAASVTFVENGRAAQKILTANIAKTAPEGCKTLRLDATRIPKNEGAPASLVFLDPPYGRDLGAKALTIAAGQGWLKDDAIVIWEEETPQASPESFSLLETRRYGQTWLTILKFDHA